MLFIFFATLTMAALLAFSVVESERTGRARYSRNPNLPDKEIVDRLEQPAKFNQAIGVSTFRALISGSVAIAAFYFYRRLGE